ncbi:MAG: 50S ribosomal protein L24 [Limisphaerales bacterium]
MRQRFHVKKDDEIVVISGTERGKRGKILRVLRDKQRVVVEGVKMVKKHMRKSQQHPNGAIIELEGSIHVSNVMLAAQHDERRARRAAPAA